MRGADWEPAAAGARTSAPCWSAALWEMQVRPYVRP